MGLLFEGQWRDVGYDTKSTRGLCVPKTLSGLIERRIG
jgi:hypothetical protein